MEIYDQLGLADHQVLAGANTAVRLQIGQNGSPDGFSIEQLQQGAARFPGIKIFEQSRNAQLLYEALTGRGSDVLWGHRIVDLVDKMAEPDGPWHRMTPSCKDETLRSAHDDLGMTFGQVDWFSTYRVHHRVASRFRVGSVFLASYAGHVHSPVGGQGNEHWSARRPQPRIAAH